MKNAADVQEFICSDIKMREVKTTAKDVMADLKALHFITFFSS